jgi:uncharacterized coiled-coil protein SlyX
VNRLYGENEAFRLAIASRRAGLRELGHMSWISSSFGKVNPDLVVRGEDGKVNTVRYEAVNAMLLNEFLKEHRKIEQQQSTITELNSAIAEQKAANAQQQKQIAALTATVQKVSDRLLLNNSEPQLVANDH